MPRKDLDSEDIFLSLSKKSEDYFQKATHLSRMLESAEVFLSKLPGKVSAEASNDECVLYFDKHGNEWGLYIATEEEDSVSPNPTIYEVKSSPVSVKVKAAMLLPSLIERIMQAHEERIDSLNNALAALLNSPLVQKIVEKEGK